MAWRLGAARVSQPPQPGEGSRGRFTLWLLLVMVSSRGWSLFPLIVSRAGVSSVPPTLASSPSFARTG